MHDFQTVRPTCVVADDHPLMREAMALTVNRSGCAQVVGEADTGLQALTLIRRLRPKVALVDLHMDSMSGIDVARQVAQLGLPTRVIIVTAADDPYVVRSAFAAGAHGFVCKGSPTENVAIAISMVCAGRRFVDPMLAHSLVFEGDEEHLSAREHDVLAMLAEGLQNKEIAARLSVSVETVKTHVTTILRKLGATSRTEAVAMAFRRSMLA